MSQNVRKTLDLGILAVVKKNADSELSQLRLESRVHLAVWFWANYFTSMYLSHTVVRIERAFVKALAQIAHTVSAQ